MLREVAKNNANDSCKRIINNLPLNSPPTLQQMIEACMRRNEVEPEIIKKKGGVSGGMVIGATEIEEDQAKKTYKPDFMSQRCGKKGHTVKYCCAPAPIHSFPKHVPAGSQQRQTPRRDHKEQGN